MGLPTSRRPLPCMHVQVIRLQVLLASQSRNSERKERNRLAGEKGRKEIFSSRPTVLSGHSFLFSLGLSNFTRQTSQCTYTRERARAHLSCLLLPPVRSLFHRLLIGCFYSILLRSATPRHRPRSLFPSVFMSTARAVSTSVCGVFYVGVSVVCR